MLDFTGARLWHPGWTALDLRGANLTDLMLLPRQQPINTVDLTGTKIRTLYDKQQTWPITLVLTGFSYERFANEQISVKDRLRWLQLQSGGYNPEIYDQLIASYRRIGQEQAARKVGVAKQWRRRHAFSPLNWLWYATVGYGYRTWLAGLWLAGFIVLGTVIFSHAYPHQFVEAVGKHAMFSPLGYTLDVLLPVVDLGEKSGWIPHGYALYWSWTLTIAGWVLATAVIAGLTGVLKRD
jgi:hypothetical protein